MVVRIILTGKRGSGKSSIGNMLIQRDIKSSGNEFYINGSQTAEYMTKTRADTRADAFEVVDTVGLTNRHHMETASEAEQKLVKFMNELRCSVNYIFFVIIAAHRNSSLDFHVIKTLFKGAEDNIILVLTSASDDYLKINRPRLKVEYGNIAMINVNFPSVVEDRDQEVLNIRERRVSYDHLLASLRSLNYAAVEPKFVSMTSAEIDKMVARHKELVRGYTFFAPFCSDELIFRKPQSQNPVPIKDPSEYTKQDANLLADVRQRMGNLLNQGAQQHAAVDDGRDVILFRRPQSHDPVSENENAWHGVALWPWVEDILQVHTLCSDQGVRLVLDEQNRKALHNSMPTFTVNMGIPVADIGGGAIEVTTNVGALARSRQSKKDQEQRISTQLKKKPITIQYSKTWEEYAVKALLSYVLSKEQRMEMVGYMVVYNDSSQVLHVYKTHGELAIELVFVASNVDPEYFTSSSGDMRDEVERGYIIYDEDKQYRIIRTGKEVPIACDLDETQHNIYSHECWRWAMTPIWPPENNGVVTQWEFPGTEHKYVVTTLGLILGMFACQYKHLFHLAAFYFKESDEELPFLHISPLRLLQIHDVPDINKTRTRVIVGKGTAFTSKVLVC